MAKYVIYKTLYKPLLMCSIFIFAILFTGCKSRLENAFDIEDFRPFYFMDNESKYAEGFAHDLYVPSMYENKLVDGVGAESYMICTEDKDSTFFYKYKDPYSKIQLHTLLNYQHFL